MPNIRSIATTILAIGGAAYILHPEVFQLLAGESLGNDVRDVVTGGSILALVLGLEIIGRLERTDRIDRRVMFWAFGLLIGVIGFVNVTLFYWIPDSFGALGIVTVCVAGIGVMVYAAYKGRIENPAYSDTTQ